MVSSLKPITPYDIDSYTLDQVLALINEPEGTTPNKKARLNLVKIFFQILGFDLSPDIALALIDEVKNQLIIATAGSGKTTMSQVRIIIEKVLHQMKYGQPLYGNRILCLVYNEHNVEPMQAMHARLVARIRSSGIQGFNIDDKIRASTIHAFCNMWREEYKLETGTMSSKLIMGNEPVELLKISYKTVKEKFGTEEHQNFQNLYKVYTYAKECMLEYDNPELLKKFPEVELSSVVLKALFTMFDFVKKNKKVYDFTDMLVFTHKLMLTNESARTRIQKYYDYVVVDEFQDATPIMHEIIKLLVGDKKSLFIGDEDQSIYAFKGADINSILLFGEYYKEGKMYLLSTNRRCSKEIVDAASHIISANKHRFEKKLLACRDGGTVSLIGYNTEEGQIMSIVKELEKMSLEERQGTAIAYRDRIYSIELTEALEEKGIPFNVISGYMPFSHELYKHVQDVLNSLYSPQDMFAQVNLYKVLPIAKDEFHEFIGWDNKKRSFRDGVERRHFKDIDFGRYSSYQTFAKEMAKLVRMSQIIHTEPLSKFFPYLYDMLLKYYWEYKLKQNEKSDTFSIDAKYTEKVYTFFNKEKLYDDLFKELVSRKELVRKYNDNKIGVTLSTFHGLKGLEYDKMFMIYMDNSIFPNLDAAGYAEDLDEYDKAMESETRLCYVAMTRPRNELRIYYPTSRPSVFVKRLQEYQSERNKSTVNEVVDDKLRLMDVLPNTLVSGGTSPSVSKSSGFLDNVFKQI